MAEPMTPEQFDAIKARHQAVKRNYGTSWANAHPVDKDLDAVIAEVERLREVEAERDRLRAALARAEAVMSKALSEAEYEEVIYLLRTYLATRQTGGAS